MTLFLLQEDCESTDDLAVPEDIFQLNSRDETHAAVGSVQDVRAHWSTGVRWRQQTGELLLVWDDLCSDQ